MSEKPENERAPKCPVCDKEMETVEKPVKETKNVEKSDVFVCRKCVFAQDKEGVEAMKAEFPLEYKYEDRETAETVLERIEGILDGLHGSLVEAEDGYFYVYITNPPRCISCGNVFPENDDGEPVDEDGKTDYGQTLCFSDGPYYPVDEENDGAYLCQCCTEAVDGQSNSLVLHLPTGQHTLKYNSTVLFYNNDAEGAIPEAYDKIALEIIRGTHSVRVDGWRSYQETPAGAGCEKQEDLCFTSLIDGWHSSMEDSSVASKIRGIQKHVREIDLPAIVVYALTSNVCTINITVYTRDKDVSKWREFFGEIQTSMSRGQGLDYAEGIEAVN